MQPGQPLCQCNRFRACCVCSVMQHVREIWARLPTTRTETQVSSARLEPHKLKIEAISFVMLSNRGSCRSWLGPPPVCKLRIANTPRSAPLACFEESEAKQPALLAANSVFKHNVVVAGHRQCAARQLS